MFSSSSPVAGGFQACQNLEQDSGGIGEYGVKAVIMK